VAPRPGFGVELTTRSDAAALAPRMDASLGFTPLLDAEAEVDTWRVVEAFSRVGPFDLDLAWSAGNGSGASARVTVARSTRVCLFARSLRVAAANRCDLLNRVGLTVGDGFAVTNNVYEVHGSGSADVPVPAFARRARLDLADAAWLPASRVQVIDGAAATRAEVAGHLQPDGGLPLGDAAALRLQLPVSLDWRLLFTLCL
jgi:hypothetical protein